MMTMMMDNVIIVEDDDDDEITIMMIDNDDNRYIVYQELHCIPQIELCNFILLTLYLFMNNI